MRRVCSVLRWAVVFLPVFLFLCAAVIPLIPGATGLFTSGAHPWYATVTGPLFLLGLVYSYPVTRLCLPLFGDNSFFSPLYFVILAAYTAIWVFAFHRVSSFFERHFKKPPATGP